MVNISIPQQLQAKLSQNYVQTPSTKGINVNDLTMTFHIMQIFKLALALAMTFTEYINALRINPFHFGQCEISFKTKSALLVTLAATRKLNLWDIVNSAWHFKLQGAKNCFLEFITIQVYTFCEIHAHSKTRVRIYCSSLRCIDVQMSKWISCLLCSLVQLQTKCTL